MQTELIAGEADRTEAPAHVNGLPLNTRIKMDGLELLRTLDDDSIPAAILDPQYRGVLDKLDFGNEATSRSSARVQLPQMPEELIAEFIAEIGRVLRPSGHLFLWMDKYHLCTGFRHWLDEPLHVVDMMTWDKGKIGLGWRLRRRTEFCVVAQKKPTRAKGAWHRRDIPDVWQEKIVKRRHAHDKPVQLQARLIEAVTEPGDIVIDPAAGSFSTMESALQVGRNFIGCDILG